MEKSVDIVDNSYHELSFFRKFINSIFYSRKLVLVIGTIAAFVLVMYFSSKKIFSDSFNDWIDPVVTVMTFIIAIALGISDLYDKWINSIEKRLTVFYVYYYESLESLKTATQSAHSVTINDEIKFLNENSLQEKTPYCMLVFDEAFLPHENDIRNLAQQLGRQQESGELKFHPFITLGKNNSIVIRNIDGVNRFTRQYSVYMFLSRIPKCVYQNKCALKSYENYDNTPINKIAKFKIKKIEYKLMKEYKESRKFIDGLDIIPDYTEPEIIYKAII